MGTPTDLEETAMSTHTNPADWLELARVHSETLLRLSWEIQDYAKAFALTGNDQMSQILRVWTKEVSAAHEGIHEMTDILTSRMVKQAQESSGNMLRAALAMCEVNKEAKSAEHEKGAEYA